MGEKLNVEEFKANLDEMLGEGYAEKYGRSQEETNDIIIDYLSKNPSLIKELSPGRRTQIAGEIQSGKLNTGKNQEDTRVIEILEAIKEAEERAKEKMTDEPNAKVIELNHAQLARDKVREAEQSLSKLIAIKLKNDLNFNEMDITFINKKKNEKGYPQNISEEPLNTEESNKLFTAVDKKIKSYNEAKKDEGDKMARRAA